ncbi:hypothetical protein HDV05_000819, partial [Chytridiales sp. JEL 0842]
MSYYCLAQYWNPVVVKIMEAMMADQDREFLSHIYTAYSECLEYLGPEFITQEQMENFVHAADVQLKGYGKRMADRDATRKDDDYDEQEEEALQNDEENDEDLLVEMSRAIHELFKAVGPAFLPYFDFLLPLVQQFIQQNANDSARHFAICVFGDVIEFCGPVAWKYQ